MVTGVLYSTLVRSRFEMEYGIFCFKPAPNQCALGAGLKQNTAYSVSNRLLTNVLCAITSH